MTRRTAKPLPPEITQSPNLRRIAEAVDGLRSVAAIALHTHTSEFLVSKFLFESLRAGVVEMVSSTKVEAREASPDLTNAAQRLFDAGDYEAVLTLAGRGNHHGDETLLQIVRRSEEKFVETAYADSLRPDRIPALVRTTKDLLEERLSPEEYFLISRIDGAWDIRSIVSVSPLREADALHVLHRLYRRGVISLKDPPTS